MKRITITVDESILEQLKAASEESMRPIATEALYRMKLGLGREKLDRLVKDGVVRKGVKELPSQGDGEFKTYFKEKKI